MGHYDIVDKRDGTIIEVKTAHTTKVLKEAYPYHYQQLAMYLSITGAKKGILFYIIMGETFNTSEYFAQYNLTLSEEQRQRVLNKIEKDSLELQEGIDKQNPDFVECVADDATYLLRGNASNWYCQSCGYRDRCSGYKEVFGSKRLTNEKIFKRTIDKIKALPN